MKLTSEALVAPELKAGDIAGWASLGLGLGPVLYEVWECPYNPLVFTPVPFE